MYNTINSVISSFPPILKKDRRVTHCPSLWTRVPQCSHIATLESDTRFRSGRLNRFYFHFPVYVSR